MALRGTPPHAALLIDVEYAELTGNDAVARSRLWSPGGHLDRAAAPDLMALAGKHLAANSAESEGGSSGFLLKALMAVPGLPRLLRLVVDRAYSAGLRKEGTTPSRPAGAGGGVAVPRTAGPWTSAGRTARNSRPCGRCGSPRCAGRHRARSPSSWRTAGGNRARSTSGRASSSPSSPTSTGARCGGPTRPPRCPERPGWKSPSSTSRAAGSPPTSIRGSGPVTVSRCGVRQATSTRSRSRRTRSSRRDGRLDADRVRRWVTGAHPAPGAHYYVCGPAPLTALVREVLAGLGVPDGQMHHERYTGGTETGAGAGAGTTVPQRMTVERDGGPVGTAVVEPGQTLLDAGLAAGLPMPYSCTVGNCGDCMVRLRAGRSHRASRTASRSGRRPTGTYWRAGGARCRRSPWTSRTPDHPSELRRRCRACRPSR